jgi:muramoyltetrapeptide carboxypeptidase LdcA involved in peptidoglycan recycling
MEKRKYMQRPKKLHKGDKVAVLSPSFAAPGRWPDVYELGLSRLKEVFDLEPVEFPTTKKLGSTGLERAKDLIAAFENDQIKGVVATLGGNDQVTYIKNLPSEPFKNNPKPFFGFSDNTHFLNFLWLNDVSGYYGGGLLNQFAMQGAMDEYTVMYLQKALFEEGEVEWKASETYNDIGLNWNDSTNLHSKRIYEPNEGWYWDGLVDAEGTTWGGCVESIDEILRHGVQIPTLEQFEDIVLFTETSEEIPSADYVFRVYRALGERGVLERVRGVLVGRPKAWEFDKQNTAEQKKQYREDQRKVTLEIIRKYNSDVPIIQNMDFGHTDPQIPLPYGGKLRIKSSEKKIYITF